jgi:putative FmdB family regulatory protein
MPAYDFRCTACDHIFEIVRSFGSASGSECCPRCEAAAKRIFTPVGVVFKGSGFHNTDYRTKPSESSSESTAAADTSPASSCGSAEACASCPAAK